MNERLPAATPPATSSSSPASTMGMRPERNADNLTVPFGQNNAVAEVGQVAAVGRPT